MDLEGIILSKIREKQILCDFYYMWNLEKKTTTHINKQNKLKQTHRYREKADGWQRGGVGGIGNNSLES